VCVCVCVCVLRVGVRARVCACVHARACARAFDLCVSPYECDVLVWIPSKRPGSVLVRHSSTALFGPGVLRCQVADLPHPRCGCAHSDTAAGGARARTRQDLSIVLNTAATHVDVCVYALFVHVRAPAIQHQCRTSRLLAADRCQGPERHTPRWTYAASRSLCALRYRGLPSLWIAVQERSL
jgi:hypothetical protein